MRVPEQTHLLFLPPHVPELEDAQAERCVALQGRPDLIRSTTRFHWWPLRIKKRQGPRQRDFRSRLGQFPSSDG
jgi:hypothetical protein